MSSPTQDANLASGAKDYLDVLEMVHSGEIKPIRSRVGGNDHMTRSRQKSSSGTQRDAARLEGSNPSVEFNC